MSTRQTEIVDIESLDVGDVILLGLSRNEWRIEQNEQVADCDWMRVRFVKVAGVGEIKRTFVRFAKFETVCA